MMAAVEWCPTCGYRLDDEPGDDCRNSSRHAGGTDQPPAPAWDLPERLCDRGQPHGGHKVMVGRYMYRCPGVPQVSPPAEPTVPSWDPDIQQALEVIGEHVAIGVAPLASALQEARAGAAVTLDRFVQCYSALAAVVGLLDRGGVRGNWAQDQAILDTARDLVTRLSPFPTSTGDTDGDTPPDPAGPDHR